MMGSSSGAGSPGLLDISDADVQLDLAADAAMEADLQTLTPEASAPGSAESDDDEPQDAQEAVPPSGLWRSVRYRCLHVGHAIDHTKLACGRKISDRYVQLDNWPVGSWHRCQGKRGCWTAASAAAEGA